MAIGTITHHGCLYIIKNHFLLPDFLQFVRPKQPAETVVGKFEC